MVTTNRTMNIGDYFEKFVSEQVAKGRFSNSSEVVRAGLRLLEEHELDLRERKSVMTDNMQTSMRHDLDVTTKEAAQLTQSAAHAMRALASAATDANQLPAIPTTKGQLRSQIAAE